MQHRNSCKQELRLPVTSTGFGISNNPLKFSPTAEAALATLLGPPQKGVLPPVEAMRQGFEDLHRHHMGLLAGARAAVRAILEKVSPQAVENRLDMNGPVRLNRTGRLWHTFMRMHQSLKDDHDGLSAFFLEDFARAYEVQGRTLRPLSNRDSQGVRP
jgi:type VI secretion system protein ImpI